MDLQQSTTTTLRPLAGYVTIINTYEVDANRAEELLNFLVRSTLSTIRFVPGFVSANFHMNFDRTQVLNYAQWESRDTIAAARENPKVVALMKEQSKFAKSFTPIEYELRESIAKASK